MVVRGENFSLTTNVREDQPIRLTFRVKEVVVRGKTPPSYSLQGRVGGWWWRPFVSCCVREEAGVVVRGENPSLAFVAREDGWSAVRSVWGMDGLVSTYYFNKELIFRDGHDDPSPALVVVARRSVEGGWWQLVTDVSKSVWTSPNWFPTGYNYFQKWMNRNRLPPNLAKTETDGPVQIGYSPVWFLVFFQSIGPNFQTLQISRTGIIKFYNLCWGNKY